MKRKFTIFILLSLIVSGLCNSFAQTSIPSGNVSGTWTLASSPYLIQGNIIIPDGQTLTIESGVTVKFQGTFKILVMGRLLSIGTVTDSVTFIPADTSNGWGGIRFDDTPATNDSSKIVYCKLYYGKATGLSPYDCGGALYIKNFSKVIINKNHISNCKSYNAGGGIYCQNSNVVISNNIISNNSAYGGGAPYGGGIYCTDGSPIITDNIILNNSSQANGAGIFFAMNFMSNNSRITNNAIHSNKAAGQAGGIWIQGVSLISNNTIYNNTALNGGGILINGSPSIIKNTIYHNVASENGGGIGCWSGSNTSIINNNISNNSAGTKGGGIYFESGDPTINNNIITNNSVSENGNGGGISCATGTSNKFSNNTISNNYVLGTSGKGGGVFFENGSKSIFNNCILFGNSAAIGKSVFLFDEASDPNFYYCDIEGGISDFGLNGNFYLGSYQNNIDAAPVFVLPASGNGTGYDGVTADWSLRGWSLCINAGTPDTTGLKLPATDLSGSPRILETRIDMGAYEQLATANCLAHYKTSFDTLQNVFILTVDPLSVALATGYAWDFGDGSTSNLRNPVHIYAADTIYKLCLKIYTQANDSCTYCSIIGKDFTGNIFQKTAGFKVYVQNTVTMTESTSALLNESTIILFPNPTTGETRVIFDQQINNVTINIFNSLGQKVFEMVKLNENQFIIDFSNYVTGMYFVEINKGGSILRTRLIKN